MSWRTITSAAANAASVAAWSPADQSKMWLSRCPARSSRITAAPGSSARVASATTGSGSYSTSISSSASRAAYASSATTNATSWPWNRTLSVASTACTSRDSVGIQASWRSSSMAPVMTARTRGCASAAAVSTEMIRACASGLRRMAPYSIPGSAMSSVNVPRPRTNRASSLRGSRPYALLIRGPVLGGPEHRLDDVLVAGAPAELAGQHLADLLGGGHRVVVEQPAGGHHHARRAEPALQAVAFGEAPLHRVEPAGRGQPFHGAHLVP